ncbi:toxin-antitoxin system HicB family antitoxin [Novosphingobium sp. KCTC 2891]|uniref:toxin-antitoxin system HicB family antitoxin n=1 Tax=Novosphingobium sp. KCTC 2891 TaxID=2989730 RepID=UPI002223CAF4|nr:toxin-antitoxin system HicB family antitoxin [Novosphingobium sp. KCTC 2891]MCW1382096.1 toxin-antitoxin system HicB family antitoxin [Novosphingobium sp. KCTC 2891]
MASPQKKAFPLRLDPALHAAVERAAAGDLRSVNAEIECLLREALARRGVKLEPAAPPVRRPRGAG